MQPRIEIFSGKKLVGKQVIMSFTENKTFTLWQSFMPRRKEISNNVGSELYSVEIYPPLFYSNFNPSQHFEKWAAVEVANFDAVPNGMETLQIPGGLYAVFIYHGPASEGFKTYQYILQTWLPASGYELDNRPHFAVMGEKYKNDDPDSEEELWIPLKSKE